MIAFANHDRGSGRTTRMLREALADVRARIARADRERTLTVVVVYGRSEVGYVRDILRDVLGATVEDLNRLRIMSVGELQAHRLRGYRVGVFVDHFAREASSALEWEWINDARRAHDPLESVKS